MSFLVKVEGSESFEVAKECVRSVNVTTDIPLACSPSCSGLAVPVIFRWIRMQEPRTSVQLW